MVGALCVAGCALVSSWAVLEGMLGLPAILAGPLAIAAAAWVLETISRRHYRDRRAPASLSVPSASLEPARRPPAGQVDERLGASRRAA